MLSVAAGLLAPASSPAQFTNVVNLTTSNFDGYAVDTTIIDNVTVTGSFIGDAFFRFGAGGSGSGVYRRMFNMSDGKVTTNNAEEGYNRPQIMDVGQLSLQSFTYDIHMSNLLTDKSGQYYVFALDINQVGSTPFLSLDNVQVYTRNGEDPSPLPTNSSQLGNLGTLRYAMNNSATQSYVIMDYNSNPGSGQQDLFLFVAKSLFTGADAGDHVYLYSSFGQYSLFGSGRTDTTPNDGFEEWALPISTDVQVPEPAAIGALLVFSVGLFWHVRRQGPSRHRRPSSNRS
ncbi:MAG TPA: hypothetical protein PLU30_09820 [Verrucomicrobiae bacterium]|nr:hypothetical protein [Verrucomicrobiae bacterium]